MKTPRRASSTRLAEAVALLIQNQAAFLGRVSEMDRRLIELSTQMTDRFARIESILVQQGKVLEALPEAIRLKIGFGKSP